MQRFYKARIDELDERIEELRSLMAEKENSFSRVLDRLSRFEESKEARLIERLDDIEFLVDDKFAEKIKTKLAGENTKLSQELGHCQRELNSYKAECLKLGKALRSRMNYHRYKQDIL